jgi:putative transposase
VAAPFTLTTPLRFAWLTNLVRAIHTDSRGTYGWRRVNAELVYGHGVIVNRKTVRKIMRLHGLHGLPGSSKRFPPQGQHRDHRGPGRAPVRPAGTRPVVGHRHHRAPHPGGQGLLLCGAGCVLASGGCWSIDSHQATPLVTNALGMAIHNRNPPPDRTVIHSDHGSQYTSWAFAQRAKDSGLLPSMGTIGDTYDNAVIESFWARMQTELLDRRRWTTRIELANAIFEYLEIFHNRQRRHSALRWRAPRLNSRSCTPSTSPDSHTKVTQRGPDHSVTRSSPLLSAICPLALTSTANENSGPTWSRTVTVRRGLHALVWAAVDHPPLDQPELLAVCRQLRPVLRHFLAPQHVDERRIGSRRWRSRYFVTEDRDLDKIVPLQVPEPALLT